MREKDDKSELVSILICSRDRREDMEELVHSILNMDTIYRFEIVVVEETNTPVKINNTNYISHPVLNRGIPFARNLALSHAKGELVVFIDDDCLIHDHWLDMLLEPFQDSYVVGVQGGVTIPVDTNSIGWIESLLGFPGGGLKRVIESMGKWQETREISTLNCAYRRWVIDKVGGFEKQLKLTGEDYILAKKACEYGRCLFVPDALVSHKARGSFSKIWRWFVRRGRAEVDVIRTGTQEDFDFGTVLKGSLLAKLCILILIGFLFFFSSGRLIPFLLIAIAIPVFMVIQYFRYYKHWRMSAAPFTALLLLPAVKIWMGASVDWGRIRGFLFD